MGFELSCNQCTLCSNMSCWLLLFINCFLACSEVFGAKHDAPFPQWGNEPELFYQIRFSTYPKHLPLNETYNITIHYERNGNIPIELRAPYHKDPFGPFDSIGRFSPDLIYFETFEMFFLGEWNSYLHVVIDPYGHYVVMLSAGVNHVIKDDLPLTYIARVDAYGKWYGRFYVPFTYLPPGFHKFNAYARYGTGRNRRHLALFPSLKPNTTIPILETFQSLNIYRISKSYNPDALSKEWRIALEDDFNRPPKDGGVQISCSHYLIYIIPVIYFNNISKI